MNTDDGWSCFAQIQAKQVEILNAAKARKGQIPTDRKTKSQLISMHQEMQWWPKELLKEVARMQQVEQDDSQSPNCCQCHPPAYPPSITSLRELTPVQINELRIETHHRGNYLLVKAATNPQNMRALIAIVEDEMGEGTWLQLHRQPDGVMQPALSIIAEGDGFIIKEPFFQATSFGDCVVRVDHVSDILRIDTYHKLWPKNWNLSLWEQSRSASDWKQEGNLDMKSKVHWKAIRSYNMALANHPSASEETVIRTNRALAYLRDESYEAALADTHYPDTSSNTSEKGLYRAGKALYGLERFSECCDVLNILCERYPSNVEATNELARARIRLSEQQYGTYDFKAIYEEVSQARQPHLEYANFVGPVAVKKSPGRGRGLFTTKAVKAGELLSCEKAFAHCYADNPEDCCLEDDLVTAIIQKLSRNPSLLPEFVTLAHGSYESVAVLEVDGRPVIDTFLIESIMNFNFFGGSGLTSKEAHFTRKKEKDEDKPRSIGVWPLGSRINHSCISNARPSFIGDLQIIRATCDMPADTELALWYYPPKTGEHFYMQEGLKQWEFECKCAICLDSKATEKTVLKHRVDLRKDFDLALEVFETTSVEASVDASQAESILDAICQTYNRLPSDVPRVMVQKPYAVLTLMYYKRLNIEKVAAMALKALESLGFVIRGVHLPTSPDETFQIEKWGLIVDDVPLMWVCLWNAYKTLAPHLTPRLLESAKTSYKICVGEDVTFEECYDKHGVLGAARKESAYMDVSGNWGSKSYCFLQVELDVFA